MATIVQKSFGFQLLLLKICGFFSSKLSKWYSCYTYFIYGVILVPISLLSTINIFFNENSNLSEVADNAFLAFQMTCLLFKLMSFISNVDKIRHNISMLDNGIFTSFSKNQEHFMNNCIKTCKRNSAIFLFFCIGSLVTWAIKPIVGNLKKLPLELWLVMDFKTKPTLIYPVMYIYVVLGVTIGAVTNGTIDPLIAGLAYHLATQIKILKNNLENLTQLDEEVRPNVLKEKIEHCIRHHTAILDFVSSFESIYSPVVFIQFVASVFVICITCYYLSIIEPFSVFFFSMMIFLVTMLAEIFLYCYYGTLLYEENNTIVTAAYMGMWYNYDIASRKTLLVLMERSKKPMIVTAGKILELSLETFTTILRRAYSLLAVLKNY